MMRISGTGFLLTCLCIAESRMLDSNELLVGEWDLSIRCDSHWFNSELFPPRESFAASEFSEDVQMARQKRKKKQPERKPSRRNHPCQLKVYSDGTFCLSPKENDQTGNPSKSHLDEHHQQQHEQKQAEILPVRGRWQVEPNPYCVTDRFFDDIHLTSFPRVQKLVASTSPHNERILQNGSIHMQCRLTGHFSPGRLARRFREDAQGWYGKGNLSRGLLVWETRKDPSSDKPTGNGNSAPQALRASFSGRRWVPSLSAIHSQDYDEDFDELD